MRAKADSLERVNIFYSTLMLKTRSSLNVFNPVLGELDDLYANGIRPSLPYGYDDV